ncbi:MAG: AAA ATPase [Parcubacteria group bacterium Athens1014_10]|nr:MAG: AAA ATPase [Parcubacteria group bacterium Athens1014_10]TSD06090.1 MAG: AAA ATPase [Parcubacteria group bacterium Athens0714_12]
MTQKEALEILKLGKNVFLTGPAGSGKTFALNAYIDFLKNKGVGVGVTASTGIAATHLNGITIHSWAGIGIKESMSEREISDLSKKRYLAKRFEKTKVLIIDEVSMLHYFYLDLVDKVCRAFKKDNRPFGGMQVVLCGDFFQLPPVSKNSTERTFANKSKIWQEMNLKICYLSEQYRQGDDVLIKVLNDIRANKAGERTLSFLRERYQKSPRNFSTATKLYTHNIDVDIINKKNLEALGGEMKTYFATSRGNKKLAAFLKKNCLAPEELRLKRGAAVMFVKNNFDKGYVNGTLGIVEDFDEDGFPVVRVCKTGKEIIAGPESWRIEEEGMAKAEIIQIPLRLAWAITVHKSQGMSLDAVEIDLSKSFVEGMGYVALSRVRSFEGLKLMGLNQIALQVNEEVLLLDKELMRMSEMVSIGLRKLNQLEKEKNQEEFLKSVAPAEKLKSVSTYEETEMLVLQKFSIKEIAEKRGLTEDTILGHLEKLIERDENLDLSYLRPWGKRFELIKNVFKETGDTRLTVVREILGESFSYRELRLARLFLKESDAR